MLVRFILFLGVSLIGLSIGAMGWQYWKNLPAASETAAVEAAEDEAAAPPEQADAAAAGAPVQNWLISPGGGLVDHREVKAFLRQDRFVESRLATVTLRAPLSALLVTGEKLPAEAYREVFADIRAPMLATGLCRPLLAEWAASCAVDRAVVQEGSYDAATETAVLRITLAFTQKPGALPLPDLGRAALFSGTSAFGAADLDQPVASPADLVALAARTAGEDCAAREAEGHACRILGLSLDWQGPAEASASWRAAWLAPLPAGMYPAPPLY